MSIDPTNIASCLSVCVSVSWMFNVWTQNLVEGLTLTISQMFSQIKVPCHHGASRAHQCSGIFICLLFSFEEPWWCSNIHPVFHLTSISGMISSWWHLPLMAIPKGYNNKQWLGAWHSRISRMQHGLVCPSWCCFSHLQFKVMSLLIQHIHFPGALTLRLP